MTNTIYFSISENSEESGDDVRVSETISGFEAKVAISSVIRIGCFGCSESTVEERKKDEEAEEFEDSNLAAVRDDQESERVLNNLYAQQVAADWPSWLSSVASDAIDGWTPRLLNTFEKLELIVEGVHSHVYKAIDTMTGKTVALKEVQFNILKPESVGIMAREIRILRRLDHPNMIKLEGLVISENSCKLYLVFEYMEQSLYDLIAMKYQIKFKLPEVKCLMHQLLSGLDHCHSRGVLHRDIKISNLLLNNEGVLKIAGFGSASFLNSNQNQPMSSSMVNFRYSSPEVLLEATDYYGVGIDLWSTGCVLADLLTGTPTSIGYKKEDQIQNVFKLCGFPSRAYGRNFKPSHKFIISELQKPYEQYIAETFKGLPSSSLSFIQTLLSIDPVKRKTTGAALLSEFFKTEPSACEPSSIRGNPPLKAMQMQNSDWWDDIDGYIL